MSGRLRPGDPRARRAEDDLLGVDPDAESLRAESFRGVAPDVDLAGGAGGAEGGAVPGGGRPAASCSRSKAVMARVCGRTRVSREDLTRGVAGMVDCAKKLVSFFEGRGDQLFDERTYAKRFYW